LKIIFGQVKEIGVWRIRNNTEWQHLYRKPDISDIRKGRLRWLGHVERMSEEITVKKVFKDTLEGKRSVGKSRKRWLGDMERDLKKTGVTGWRKIGEDRDTWKLILKEARALRGLHSQWRETRRDRGRQKEGGEGS
jgi:hypothetical protein